MRAASSQVDGFIALELKRQGASSLLKKPPGEGTGPTKRADFRRNLVGRVPSRGEQDVSQQAASRAALRRRPPDMPFPGFSRRSGRFPALPYPPLEQRVRRV